MFALTLRHFFQVPLNPFPRLFEQVKTYCEIKVYARLARDQPGAGVQRWLCRRRFR